MVSKTMLSTGLYREGLLAKSTVTSGLEWIGLKSNLTDRAVGVIGGRPRELSAESGIWLFTQDSASDIGKGGRVVDANRRCVSGWSRCSPGTSVNDGRQDDDHDEARSLWQTNDGEESGGVVKSEDTNSNLRGRADDLVVVRPGTGSVCSRIQLFKLRLTCFVIAGGDTVVV